MPPPQNERELSGNFQCLDLVKEKSSYHKDVSKQIYKVNMSTPQVIIVEEPASKTLRFRYECEGRSAGSIPGASSTDERKTYPTIKVLNYTGPVHIITSCVTSEKPYR